jgi:hypothetical protein
VLGLEGLKMSNTILLMILVVLVIVVGGFWYG